MDLDRLYRIGIQPAVAIMAPAMWTPDLYQRAVCMLLAAALQETALTTRVQNGGPARSFYQFEPAGIRAVLNNPATASEAQILCITRDVLPTTQHVYAAIAGDDVLASGFARLLLWADPAPLPALADEKGAWGTYLRCWMPGQPRPDDWAANYAQALQFSREVQP